MPPSSTDPARPRVAYLLGRAPQPASTFTNDEIAALAGHAEIVRAGLVGDGPAPEWVLGPPLWSLALWRAVGSSLLRHPRALLGSVGRLLIVSIARPRDAAVALRAALAGCYLAGVLDVDLVHAQFAGPAAAGAYVWHRLTGRPYTIRVHAYDIYRPYRWVGTVLRSSAGVVAISDHAARHVSRRWGVACTVVRVGISPTAVAQRDARPPSRPLKLISVGALEPKKGHDLLIRATRRLNRTEASVTLDIYGDGSQREALAVLADASTTFCGFADPQRMRDVYREYDAFALAARVAADGDMDGIPVVLMEASLSGLPVITTTVAGIPELIQDGDSGWSVVPGEGELAAAIDAVIGDYPAAQRRAARARDRVIALHDLERTTEQLANSWVTIIATKRS